MSNYTLLQQDHDEPEVKRSAAEALGVMKAGKSELLSILENEAQPLPLRQGAARALSIIGAPSGEPVPMLIVELREQQVTTQVKRIQIRKEVLAPDLSLDLVAIPEGKFLMGSSLDEEARDWSKYSLPETEELDIEEQHWVQVPSFWMSRFPITQAQWQVIANLPIVNLELKSNPANFKGDSRPIEVVNWYEAIEFSERLSRYLGKTYRLPSEAEWEYACRAGSYEPFHFGSTLSTDWANYNGTCVYGVGVPGEYRQQTTNVGKFGIVNAFGLADMHGNVWEWCLDHWYPTYDGAPINGSAWITKPQISGSGSKEKIDHKKNNYRLLRGGSWNNHPGYCRSAHRDKSVLDDRSNNIGFRIVCDAL